MKLTLYLVIAALLQIIWGLTPSASKIVIDEIPVELYITIRWTMSGVIFLTYLVWARTWKKICLKDFAMISLLGILGYGVASFGTLYGLKLGGVTNFALMASISPIISSLLSILILGERPRKTFFLALIMSVVGLILLVTGKYQISTFSIAGISALLIIGAYLCEGLVFVFSKRFKKKVDTSQYLAITQSATAIFMWVLQFTTLQQISLVSSLTQKGIVALIYVSIVACVLCLTVLYWLLNHVDGHKLALFESLHTISAVIFGYLIFGGEMKPLMLIGGLFILFSLVSGSLLHKKEAPNPPPD